ncbi:hypothetical protein FH972_011199 [Carpinus fangiana]|uniref:Uncharacterized protein n=1 Tax=Carpinus fangiana TaxID=176857 RepID=A0A660KSF9_9ROSI|nr:hypothetical protein FH972_011199 [Carpinus fangiana]
MTRLLYFLEPVRSEASFAKELGGRRATLGDKQKGAGVEVIEQVDMVGGGAEGATHHGSLGVEESSSVFAAERHRTS